MVCSQALVLYTLDGHDYCTKGAGLTTVFFYKVIHAVLKGYPHEIFLCFQNQALPRST
jgi:hypothetical protein